LVEGAGTVYSWCNSECGEQRLDPAFAKGSRTQMKLTNLRSIVAACLAGLLGGMLASRAAVHASLPDVVRASAFELLDTTGRPIARWSTDPITRDVHLSLLSRAGGTALDLAVWSDGRPFIAMNGRDGKKRVVIELDESDKPLLAMNDERWEGRILLGHQRGDAPEPSDPWDSWRLEFRPFGGGSVALLGMNKTAGLETRGVLIVNGERVPQR
jgi:hypothetical protein